MTFSDDILSDHMNRIPLAVFLVENNGGKFYFISAFCWIELIICYFWLFQYSELRLFDKQEAPVTKTHISDQGRKDFMEILEHLTEVRLKPVLVLQTHQEL